MDFCRKCGKCCYNTEMQLSKKDIDKILSTSKNIKKKEEFVKKNEEGFWILKNINDHCFFFDPKENYCKIYDYRPTGCQFYPLLYNVSSDTCSLDDYCPYKKRFYKHKPVKQKKCRELKNWIKSELL